MEDFQILVGQETLESFQRGMFFFSRGMSMTTEMLPGGMILQGVFLKEREVSKPLPPKKHHSK